MGNKLLKCEWILSYHLLVQELSRKLRKHPVTLAPKVFVGAKKLTSSEALEPHSVLFICPFILIKLNKCLILNT